MQGLNETDVLADAINEKEASLSKLYYWLQFEKHTWILGAGIGWFPHTLILKGLTILALIFAPYMLWHLFKAKWYKSLITFFGFVLLPYLVYQFLAIQSSILNFLFLIFPLIAFYCYTWIISYMIKNHLNKLQTLKRWKKEGFINKSITKN